MDKVVKVGGKDIKIRALTWSQKKKLKANGADLSNINPSLDNDELVEKVVELSVGDKSILDPLEIHEVYELFRSITKLSFLGKDEAKNSDGPQS